jgi:tryptophanyl-tRNA synthetase
VGRDQKQHVEVTRDIAVKVNSTYGDVLKIPAPRIKEETAVVPGLDGQKMSKSYDNILGLFEEEKPFRKKIMGLLTDSTPVEAPKDPDTSLIVTLYKLVATPDQVAAMEADFRRGGTGYGDFKKRLFEGVWEFLAPMRAKRAELVQNLDFVHDVLRRGAEKARGIAQGTMDRVRKATGLR